jgi:ribosome-associated translation inhibitor RaiA
MEQQVREPTIVVRGDVPDQMVAYARGKLAAIVADAPVPVLSAELRLDHHADPARERPDYVEATIDLDGTPVRAHRNAATMPEAIDRALARLRRRVEAANELARDRVLGHRDLDSWHHDDRPTERPHVFPRPVEDRVLVRRKTFALHPESIEAALSDLETLDHDFFLFVHDETDTEAVVYRIGGGYGLMQRTETPEAIKRVEIPLELGPHPATTTLENALAILDETNAPFEFFVDAAGGRGQVAYRRYDGHYGLVLPT